MEPLVSAIAAWLLYMVWGLIASMLQGEKFDPLKLARSLVWAIMVAVISLAIGMPPEMTLREQATIIEQTVGFIMNSGAGVTMIWFLDRLYLILKALASKLTVAMSRASPPQT